MNARIPTPGPAHVIAAKLGVTVEELLTAAIHDPTIRILDSTTREDGQTVDAIRLVRPWDACESRRARKSLRNLQLAIEALILIAGPDATAPSVVTTPAELDRLYIGEAIWKICPYLADDVVNACQVERKLLHGQLIDAAYKRKLNSEIPVIQAKAHRAAIDLLSIFPRIDTIDV